MQYHKKQQYIKCANYFVNTFCFIAILTIIVYVSIYAKEAFQLRKFRILENGIMYKILNTSKFANRSRNHLSGFSIKCKLGYPGNVNNCINRIDKKNHLNPTIPDKDSQIAEIRGEESDTVIPNTMIEETSYIQCEPPREERLKCGHRIADKMCCEYKWKMNHKDDIQNNPKCTTKSGFGVIGGEIAEPGVFPHMAALGWSRKGEENSKSYIFLCGGSLISDKFVLTAAHCTYVIDDRTNKPTPKMVRMGTDNILKTKDKNRQDKTIKTITTHPEYNATMFYYDIALLEMYTAVWFTKTVHPACLSVLVTKPNTNLNITGWGITKMYDRQMSDKLQMATVKMIDRPRCKKMLYDNQSYNRKFPSLLEHQLCAGVEDGGVDTCKGDSGGPLQVMADVASGSMHTVVGVTSFGHFCAEASSPGIYTSVSYFLPWIEKMVWPVEYSYRKRMT